MKVNFDGMRRLGVSGFNGLVEELNGRIQDDGETISDSRSNGDALCVGDIKNEIDAIRNCLATLVSLEDENEGIKCMVVDLAEFAPKE